MSNNSFEKYNRVIGKRNKIRWVSVLIYFSIVMTIILLPIFIQVDDLVYTITLLFIVFGGGAFLVYSILFPYFNEIEIPQAPDGDLIDGSHGITADSTFNEEVRLKLVYLLVVPFLLLYSLFTIFFILKEDYVQGLIFALVAFFFTLILILFDRITVIADREKILIKLGPFKDEIEITNVKSIRPTIVKPLREYMGVGKRLGSDGSIGYIAYRKAGVRIERYEGKDIVVTINYSQELTNLVRYFKS